MITTTNPSHQPLVDALNTFPEKRWSTLKQVGKTCALSAGLLGFLFWNAAPQWMEYILWAAVVIAWGILVGGACTAAPLWAIGTMQLVNVEHDFEAVAAQLKLLDPSLSCILRQIEQKIERQTCDWQWLNRVVGELQKHQKLLEQTLMCTIEDSSGTRMNGALYKNLHL